jgi:hypothetical protein
MGLLKSVSNVPGIDFIDYRDQYYYNKHEFRARVKIEGLRRAFYCSPTEFEDRVKHRKFYGRITDKEFDTLKQNAPTILKLLEFRQSNRKNKSFTFRMEYDTMAVFSSNLQVLHDAFDNIQGITVNYTQVETEGYAGIKTFVNEPKHKYRVYFKSKRIEPSTKESIGKILETNNDLRGGPALKQWLKQNDKTGWRYWQANYLSSNYFIDYNEESYLSYFALMHGEILGKKYKLEKRSDKV